MNDQTLYCEYAPVQFDGKVSYQPEDTFCGHLSIKNDHVLLFKGLVKDEIEAHDIVRRTLSKYQTRDLAVHAYCFGF